MNPDCTSSEVEIDLSAVVSEIEMELSMPKGDVCVGDVIYEGPELCRDSITLFETVTDASPRASVQFRLADCVLSVERITRR